MPSWLQLADVYLRKSGQNCLLNKLEVFLDRFRPARAAKFGNLEAVLSRDTVNTMEGIEILD